ncbi:hypothetical protein A3B56_03475 [Candidatus Roizmanbacteria bacterium RIFCSPLOWO2_01_FULL_45_11]|uniref:Peptidase S24/S26A/S26B/S26C domain-containing protein n=1 Tax=Candidatus Roizmanbacteria bacterium RIFCSPLOWO2_01_FULL_45_11 TaxID=1802070 RepID=A0A1F7JF69_9BACT|nr:MAG: hypothetical protein A3B56_03475 [Candidatus Roizmanbacteria bacterium RIFCSPLOWO2_01_FULL_45_11]
MEDQKLTIVKQFYARKRRLPTYTEMLVLFHVASRNAIHWIVTKWIEAGILQKDGRNIAPTDVFFALPVLGTIQAGMPVMEEYYDTEGISLDTYFVKNPGYTYVLRVSGDSMINAGIHEGDLVVVDKKQEAQHGDVVAALIDHEWTLKYFNNQNGTVYLTAANDRYPAFYPKQNLSIGGVVTKVIKEYY